MIMKRRKVNPVKFPRRKASVFLDDKLMDRVVAESLALYVRMWLANTSEIPEKEKDAAILQAQARYDKYLKSLGKQLMATETIFGTLLQLK